MPHIPSRRAALASLAATALGGCSAPGTFNALVPGDAGATRVAEGVAFGPSPRQKLDVYAPPDARGLPALLFIYGGSWRSGSRSDYGFVGRALASRGMVVAVADYRLVPEVVYPGFVEDGALALAFWRDNAARFGGDPRKLFIMGHSAGAYNAMMVALDPPRGVRLSGAIGLSGPYDFLPLDVSATRDAFGEFPDLAQTQPINRVTARAPPVLLGTGADDTTVYPRNTAALAKRLRAAGGPVEERIYPGVGHVGTITAFARPFRDDAPVLEDVVRFVSYL